MKFEIQCEVIEETDKSVKIHWFYPIAETDKGTFFLPFEFIKDRDIFIPSCDKLTTLRYIDTLTRITERDAKWVFDKIRETINKPVEFFNREVALAITKEQAEFIKAYADKAELSFNETMEKVFSLGIKTIQHQNGQD